MSETTLLATIRWVAPLTYEVSVGTGHADFRRIKADNTGAAFDRIDAEIVALGYSLDSFEWDNAGNHFWTARTK